MAKTTAGRPPKDEGEKGSRQVRVMDDVGEMISWIIRVEGGTTATLLDPMIRAQVTARYKKHEVVIQKIKEAQETLDKVEREAKATAAEPKDRRKKAE